MPEISVLMPSLNVARYYEKCMDSVLSQTFEDFEVLAVDAGSTDGTLEMIERYQAKDSRVRLLRSPVKSYGAQMNLAMDAAEGKYIAIVETDDCAEPDMLECLHDAIVEAEADYAKGIGTLFYETSAGQTEIGTTVGCPTSLHRIVVVPCKMPVLFETDNFLWTGLYKRSLLKDIRFSETPGAAFQDIGVLFRLMHAAERAVFLDHPVYRYRQDNELASSYSPKSLRYTRYEYEQLKPFVATCDKGWKTEYYKKLVNLTLDRFSHMATGEFWPDVEEDTNWLREQTKQALEEKILTKETFDNSEVHWQKIQHFLQSDHAIYDYFYQDIMKKTADSLQALMPCKQHGTIIFGCGVRGKKLLDFLEFLHVPVRAFADNDAQKQGTFVEEKRVLSAAEAVQEAGEPQFLIANAKHADDIRAQLLAMGVAEARCQEIRPTKDLFVLRMLYRRLAAHL